MHNETKWTANHLPKIGAAERLALMSLQTVEKVRTFHQSFPQYKPTPLISLGQLAGRLGIGGIYIKDESQRFGLNAFKVLGGSYAVASFIARETGLDISQLDYAQLTAPETKKQLGDYTFFTATDGNHGRGVAWAASQIGQQAVVYMPRGSSPVRLANIRRLGARADILDMNYDAVVRHAYAESQKTPRSVAIQDTAWEGYEEIPGWVMQGYATMALETLEQMQALGAERPTHVFLQAGVGSMPAGISAFLANRFPDACPLITVVESNAADCLFQSALKGDGSTVAVGGDHVTIMAGLACGEANVIAWDILREKAGFFAALPDYAAAHAMRMLASPLPGDAPVTSGESGAAGMACLLEALTNPACENFKQALGLDENSRVLLFSTEGDTDPAHYRDIVWKGKYPVPY